VALVALASIKGAPGVTTSAIALASVWPAARPLVVVEVDPAGGDLAARRSLSAQPSVVSLAAAVRRDHSRREARLLDHCQDLPGGLHVVAGTPAPAEMLAAVDVVADALPLLAADAAVDVLADCGRLDSATLLTPAGEPGSARATALQRLLSSADLVLVVSRGELADLSHVQAWLPSLRSLNQSAVLLLVGKLSWHAAEVGAALGADVLSHLPEDRAGGDVVGGRSHRGGVGHLPLLRAARHAADRIIERLPEIARSSADDARVAGHEFDGVAAAAEGVP
jgi:MinD-like ATPase involved in chromosome partitioning or flagellar assembly